MNITVYLYTNFFTYDSYEGYVRGQILYNVFYSYHPKPSLGLTGSCEAAGIDSINGDGVVSPGLT